MLTIIIYAAEEYPKFIKFHCDTFSVANPTQIRLSNTVTSIYLLTVDFMNEIIAVTDEPHTLWLNRDWTDSPFTKETLLPNWPLK